MAAAASITSASDFPTFFGGLDKGLRWFMREYDDEIRRVGCFRIPMPPDLLKLFSAEIKSIYDVDNPATTYPFNGGTYWGYQKRPGVQQEIVCLNESHIFDTSPYQILFRIADNVMSIISPGTKCRKSPVFWRYVPTDGPTYVRPDGRAGIRSDEQSGIRSDEQSGIRSDEQSDSTASNADTSLGFDTHIDFSILGITFQCAPGLFYGNPDGTRVDMWDPENPCILVTFGGPDSKYRTKTLSDGTQVFNREPNEYGYTPFVHGVHRISGNLRLAGGVFVDPIKSDGTDDVAKSMHDYDSAKVN